MTTEREKELLKKQAAGRRARRLLDKALGDLEAAVTAAEQAGLKSQARKLTKLDQTGVALLQSWPDDKSGRTT